MKPHSPSGLEDPFSLGREQITGSPSVLLDGTAQRAALVATVESLSQDIPAMSALTILDDRTREQFEQDPELRRALPPRVLAPADARSVPERLASAESDVVVIQAGALLPSGWLDRLRAAAYSDSVCASASALVVAEGSPTDSMSDEQEGKEPEAFANAIESPEWGAVYIRRDALALTAWRLTEETSGGRPLLDALETCLRAPGLTHRLASDVVVMDQSSRGSRRPPSPPAESENQVRPRPPKSAREIRVMVDARCLDRPLSGTQVHVLNLAKALSDTQPVALSILLPRRVHPTAEPYLNTIHVREGHYTPERLPEKTPAIFHRPYQFGTVEEVHASRELGQRLVLTHQDMILDRTAAYHSSPDAWKVFRDATAEAFVAADQVGFFSRHAARDATSDDLLAADKVSVVPPGVDHPVSGATPYHAAYAELGAAPFLLVMGAARGHKNRLFALRLFIRLVEARGRNGRLVLAGDHPQNGSSVPDEEMYLAHHPDTRERVLDVGLVTDGEKQWLYENAQLVLFPSLYEGFGLVPFEAAACGTPCVYGWRSALPEYLPEAGAVLEGWDLDRCADAVIEILDDEARSEGIVSAIQEAGARLTWEETARGYLEVYRRALAAPGSNPPYHAGPGRRDLVRSHEGSELTHPEIRLLNLYRGRPVFRGTVEGALRSEILAMKVWRRIRRRAGAES